MFRRSARRKALGNIAKQADLFNRVGKQLGLMAEGALADGKIDGKLLVELGALVKRAIGASQDLYPVVALVLENMTDKEFDEALEKIEEVREAVSP